MSITSNGGGGSRLVAKLVTIATAVAITGAAAMLPLAAGADQISDLQAQIAALQAQLSAMSPSTAMTADKCTFTRSLTVGIRGDDVMCLQKHLMGTGHFTYSGGATGYFGNVTKSSVAAWQAANGVTPAAGYFGPISRAKYDMLMAMVPTPTPTPSWTPTPTPTTSTSATPTPVGGTGLTVAAAATQPESALAPALAARLPAVRVVLTASADGDVTVNSLTVERQGQADDSAIQDVVLLDDANTQIGLAKTLNAAHQAMLNEPLKIMAGTSKTYTVAFNRPSAGSNGGQIAKFAVVGANAGTAAVTGSFPIVGNGMTINETLSIGSLASPARGANDPGAARSNLEVGTKGFISSGARWTIGSAEAVALEQVRWYQAGSAGTSDLSGVMVNVKGTDYAATASSDGKYYVAVFTPAIDFAKGETMDLYVKTTVEGGSNRTIDFDIQRRTDVVARGKTFGYYIIAANGSTANTSTQGEGFTSTEPYYDGYQHTISTGSLRVEKSNNVTSGNVPVSVTGIALGAFGIEAKGEPIQISSFKLSFQLSGGVAGTELTNIGIYDANGGIVAGPKDPVSAGTVTFSDTWTVPTGYNVYTIKGKLGTGFAEGNTLIASVDPDGDITAKGQTTGLTITASPTSSTSANTMTVRRAALKVSVGDSPTAQNVVRGVNGYLFAKIQYDATASGEDLRITGQDVTFTPSGTGDVDDINNCQLFDGTTALNTGGNVVSPSGTAVGTAKKGTYTLDNNLFVLKGTVKIVEAKCNISSSFVADATISIGLTAATGNDTTVVGKDTGTSVTEGTTNSAGPTMTVRSGGSLSVALDPSSASERYGLAGKIGVASSAFQLSSIYEPIKLTKFGFNLASSTASTSDILKIAFWDGVTEVGQAVFTADNYQATSTFLKDFIIPKDGQKVLNATVDLIARESIGRATTIGGDTGHLAVINYDAFRTTATEGVGQASGSTLNPTAGSDTAAKGIRIVKTYPTLARLSLPTNTLANGDNDLYRFSVTAPTDGDVGLYKFAFRIGSTTVATTSNFRLYAYTDPGFGTQAYGQNPINARGIDCVGKDSYNTVTVASCAANTNNSASSSQIVVYFDPVSGTSLLPGHEAINVPAGQSRYFRLIGNVSRVTTGDSFQVALVGDAAFFPTINTRPAFGGADGGTGVARDTLAIAEFMASSSMFVWSPNTTTTSATTTNDWLTGYLLPGLPSTEMSAQTLSK